MLATAFSQVAQAPPCVQHGRGVVVHHAPRGRGRLATAAPPPASPFGHRRRHYRPVRSATAGATTNIRAQLEFLGTQECCQTALGTQERCQTSGFTTFLGTQPIPVT